MNNILPLALKLQTHTFKKPSNTPKYNPSQLITKHINTKNALVIPKKTTTNIYLISTLQVHLCRLPDKLPTIAYDHTAPESQ